VHDAGHNPLDGATVSGAWSGSGTGSGTCTTNSTGSCVLTRSGIRKKNGSVTYTVGNITRGTDPYDSASNDGASSVTVLKP